MPVAAKIVLTMILGAWSLLFFITFCVVCLVCLYQPGGAGVVFVHFVFWAAPIPFICWLWKPSKRQIIR